MKEGRSESTISLKSIALGIVLGISFTAVVTSIAALFAVNDFNRSVRFTLDRIRSTIFVANYNSFFYPHSDEIEGYDVSTWQSTALSELGVTLLLPPTWEVKQLSEDECVGNTGCLAFRVDSGSGFGEPVLTISNFDTADYTELSEYPAAAYIAAQTKLAGNAEAAILLPRVDRNYRRFEGSGKNRECDSHEHHRFGI
jgi:hypothetical protein